MTPVEAVLALVLVALAIRDVLADRAHAAERRRLVHALIARSAPEYASMERTAAVGRPKPDDAGDPPLRPVPVGLE